MTRRATGDETVPVTLSLEPLRGQAGGRALLEITPSWPRPVYLVGGAVRDLLLGRSVRDLDVAVEADVTALAAALATKTGGKVRLHPEFGTASLRIPDGGRLDLASTRRESYERPGATPRVAPAGLAEDLARRDFTINALAVPLNGPDVGVLIDPYGGWRDLQDRRLRVLHADSFEDDPTRLLRAVRLAVRHGLELAPETAATARAMVAGGGLSRVTGSRLAGELGRIGGEPDPGAVLAGLARLDALAAVDPALATGEATGWDFLTRAFEAAALLERWQGPPVDREALLWLALAWELEPEQVSRLSDRLEMPSRQPTSRVTEIEALRRVAEALCGGGGPAPHRVVALLEGLDGAALAAVAATSAAARAWVKRYVEELAGLRLRVRGSDLLAHGFASGPEVGRALAATRAARLDGRITAEEELEYALGELRRGRP